MQAFSAECVGVQSLIMPPVTNLFFHFVLCCVEGISRLSITFAVAAYRRLRAWCCKSIHVSSPRPDKSSLQDTAVASHRGVWMRTPRWWDVCVGFHIFGRRVRGGISLCCSSCRKNTFLFVALVGGCASSALHSLHRWRSLLYYTADGG